MQSYSIYPLGNNALVLDFGNVVDQEINRQVLHLFHTLRALSISWVTDIVPAYSSLAIYYNVLAVNEYCEKGKTAYETVAQYVTEVITQTQKPSKPDFRSLKIPVCYSKNFALDIQEVAEQKMMSVEEVIHLHTSKSYTVFMLGFLPGFAYMGLLNEELEMPRKKQPRPAVPGGSVGIVGRQTGIYPLRSPGGWQIIGRTPLQLFNKMSADPIMFQPGDEVRFYPISENEFENY